MQRLVYIDGNNNQYRIAPDRLDYVPVTAAESSSGVYAGGEPATVAITPAQHAELAALCDQIAADAAHVLDARRMGCGTVIRGEVSTFCRADSPRKAELERALAAVLGRAPG